MPAVLVQALNDHRRQQRADREQAGDDWHETGLVFTTASGRHVEPRNLNIAYSRLLARTDIRPIRFHDLRHTCATSFSPRTVINILGHSQISVTMNIYGHVILAMQDEAASQIDQALGEDEG